jgi:hypothetical protein
MMGLNALSERSSPRPYLDGCLRFAGGLMQ